MSVEQPPEFDPEDPHHGDRVRLHDQVGALRAKQPRQVLIDDLREIATKWTTYAPHDLLNDVIAERAREEIERRGEKLQ